MKAIAELNIQSKIVKIKFMIKYVLGAFFVFSLVFIMMKIPGASAQGVADGIDICLNTLIPSLYPFMIITNIVADYSWIFERIPCLSTLTNVLFSQPPSSFSAIFFSVIGGLPVGIKMAGELYKKGHISENQFKRLSLFCMNAGPAFTINAVGLNMLNSIDIGKILYASLVLSSLTIGVLTRFFSDGITVKTTYTDSGAVSYKNSLSAAVVNASKSVLIISSWVIAFSCFNSIIEQIITIQGVSVFIRNISEITVGCKLSAEMFTVPVIAGVIGFGGICGHLQVWSFLSPVKMKYKYFLVSRILNSSLAMMYCNLLLKAFPPATTTFSAGVKPMESGISVNEFIAVMMLVMAIFSILGDDFTLQKRRKKNSEKLFDFFAEKG